MVFVIEKKHQNWKKGKSNLDFKKVPDREVGGAACQSESPTKDSCLSPAAASFQLLRK